MNLEHFIKTGECFRVGIGEKIFRWNKDLYQLEVWNGNWVLSEALFNTFSGNDLVTVEDPCWRKCSNKEALKYMQGSYLVRITVPHCPPTLTRWHFGEIQAMENEEYKNLTDVYTMSEILLGYFEYYQTK